MGARTKLNMAAINGSIIIAAVVGAALGSWLVFWIVAIVLIVGDLYVGSIRLNNRPPGQRRR
jgi:hypothetical protein